MPRGLNPYDEAGFVQRRLWTPAQVNQPVFWLDAADLSTITISTGVSVWRDKTGKGVNAVQATAANQPSYGATLFPGSLPGVLFDGINDQMDISTNAGQNLTHGVYWVFARMGAGSGSDSYRPDIGILHASNGDAGALHYINAASQGASYPYYGNPTITSYDNAQSYSNNVPYLMSFQLNGTGWGVWRNGSLEGTTSPAAGVPNTNNAGYTIARQNNLSRWSNNVYGEILMVQNPDALIRQRVEGYLSWKWGIRLNASHTFVNRPPLIGD